MDKRNYERIFQIFGLDYVRYSELCPADTPVDLLKLSFQCCLVSLWGRK